MRTNAPTQGGRAIGATGVGFEGRASGPRRSVAPPGLLSRRAG
jgi:hypothetical protein